MGFSLQAFFESLMEIYCSDLPEAEKLAKYEAEIKWGHNYAVECGHITPAIPVDEEE